MFLPMPALDAVALSVLKTRLAAQPGVREVRFFAAAGELQLRVDAAGFDQQHVLRLLAEQT